MNLLTLIHNSRLDLRRKHNIYRFLSYFFRLDFPTNDGLQLRPPVEGEIQFGAANSFMDKPVLFPEMDATSFLPEGELQFKQGTETKACVTHACQNHIQGVQKRKYNIDDNRSERLTAKLSGTTWNGNNAYNVLTSIRKDKTVPEARWPFADGMTWDQYYSPIPADVIQEALRWEYNINHWPVNMRDDKEVQEAHKRFGSIIVAGDAWYLKNGMYYSPAVGRYNHMFVRAKYTPPGAKGLAYDSYFPFYKDLNPSYDFYQYGYVVDIMKISGSTDGEKLYNVLAGKEILLTEAAEGHAKGEAYRLYPDHWEKTTIIISDKKLFDVANQAWRDNKSFVGVNAKVFLELKKYYTETFGTVNISEQIEGSKFGLADVQII